MIDLNALKKGMGQIDFRLKRQGIYKVLAPFFHEDGDMYDIFLEESPNDPNLLRITDHGLTIMKLSYVFDLDTPTKRDVLHSIVSQNRAIVESGEIFVDIPPEMFQQYLYQMIQTLTKVSNLEILSKENVKSMFYDLLDDFIKSKFSKYDIVRHYIPLADEDELLVDYKINASRPIFMYGVRENTKASKVVISCLNFQKKDVPFRSLIVHENLENLNSFNKRQITNISDKQFWTLDDFKKEGIDYIHRELSA